jgi:hypothetical protein
MSGPLLLSLTDSVNKNFNVLIENKQRKAASNPINYRCTQNKILFKQNKFIHENPHVSTKDRLPRSSKNKLQKLAAMSNMPPYVQIIFNYHLEQNFDLDYTTKKVISERTGISETSVWRAHKWLVDHNIMVIKQFGVGRLRCRQFNLRITEWSMQPLRNKDFFFDTLRNALVQIEPLISIKNNIKTSLIENKKNQLKPNIVEIEKQQKEIDATKNSNNTNTPK